VTFAEDLVRLIEEPLAVAQRLAQCREAAAALSPERFDEAFDRRHRLMLERAAKQRLFA
jgi:hypothetical protein